jgi:hypothetical protein
MRQHWRKLRAYSDFREEKGPGIREVGEGAVEESGCSGSDVEERYEMVGRQAGMVEKRIDGVYGVVKGGLKGSINTARTAANTCLTLHLLLAWE